MSRQHPAGPPAALALAAAMLTAAAPVATAGATPQDGVTDAGLEVLSVLPAELRPGGRVVVRGRVTGGADGLAEARVEVRRAATRSSSVSSLERWTAAVDPEPGPAAGDEPFDDPADAARTELTVDLGAVAAGASVPFMATLDAADVGLRETAGAAGAYGLQLLLSDGDETAPVDDERGFLLWSPPVELQPTRLSTTVTLQGPPPLPDTGLPDPAVLVEQAAPGGRLDRLVAAAGALEAGWVVDPVLLAGMAAAADPGATPTGPAPGPSGTTEPEQPSPGTPDDTATDGTGADAADPDGTGAEGAEPDGGDPDGAATTTGQPDDEAVPDPVPDQTTSTADAPPAGPTAQPTTVPTGPGTPGGPVGPTAPDAVAVATGWLGALADAREGREVVLLDWADPDPARLRSADDPAQAWETLRRAQQAALPDGLAHELLAGDVRSDVLVATRRGISAPDLVTLGEDRDLLLLPGDAVPLSDPFALTFTPDAVTEVDAGGESWTAVLDDPTLSADTAAAVEGSPLALTRVLARLATTTLQRPNDPRLLAAALPADLDPAPGAAEQVAGALASTAWAEPVPLSTALGTSPSDAPREPLPTDRDPDLPGVQDLLDAVADGRAVAEAVAAPQDPVAAAALDLRAAATLSRSAEADAAAELAARLREQTSGTVAGAYVVPGARVTLVAAQAALPVTVVNDLTTEVALVLEVRSRSPRLQVPESRVPVTVRPGQRAVVDVPVVAIASGPAEVTSQLMTAGGRPWGPESAVTVTVATQAEGRVLTGAGVVIGAVFVLGAARAFVRNRRGRELVGAGPVEP